MDVIVAELFKRHGDDEEQPQCEEENEFDGKTKLRILAVFMVLISSAIGVYFPLLASRYSFVRVPSWVFFIAKFFGSGVIIATAFVHLLEPAADNLGNPCLGGTFADYPWAFGICLMSLFLLFLVEIVSHHYIHLSMGETAGEHNHSHNMPSEFNAHRLMDVDEDADDESLGGHSHTHNNIDDDKYKLPHFGDDGKYQNLIDATNMYDDSLDYSDSKNQHANSISKENGQVQETTNDDPLANVPGRNHFSHDLEHQDITPNMTPEQKKNSEKYLNQLTAVFILEFGIIFHSVFIGLSLAVAGEEFRTLFVVIVFHQMFEGLGLGTRLAETYWPHKKRWLPFLLGFGFTICTPIAIAIGIGVRHTFSPGSRKALITNGVFDSISAGILVYTGLVELMAHEFLFSSQFKGEGGFKRMLYAYVIMATGAGVMALLGRWA
ncbi:Zinc-regulated transporter 2 [Nakaseomyces bracarensis]|uniref:Zinc-regulated transporter 2 n=1 Tax=Nakaseomyces bracarensis TaxID=273131 RepID=A0ABR4NT42_9SACH